MLHVDIILFKADMIQSKKISLVKMIVPFLKTAVHAKTKWSIRMAKYLISPRKETEKMSLTFTTIETYI